MRRANRSNITLLSTAALVILISLSISSDAFAGLSTFIITDSTVTLRWTAPGDDDEEGQASSYDIRYSFSMIDENNWETAGQAANPPLPAPAGSQEVFTVDDLVPDKTYYLAIKTSDEMYNWSPLSNVVEFSTLDNIPPGSISDLEAMPGEDEDEINIEWHAPGDNGNSGTASSYIIKTHTEFITEDNWNLAVTVENPPDPLEGGTFQAFELEDLEEGQVCYIAIKTVDEADNISEISNIDFATPGADPNTGIDDPLAELPLEFSLKQNYPNPFNPTTNIEFSIASASDVKLDIYNTLGNKVSTVVNDYLMPGYYSVTWSGESYSSNRVSSGIYFYILSAGEYIEKKKMIMIK